MSENLVLGGRTLPRIGQGTWFMGEALAPREVEIQALRAGFDAGLTLVDTAEMYGNGAAEELVGEALAAVRDDAFIVDKVLPWKADRRGVVDACEAALGRLRTDRIDLYLLHWRGAIPLAETVAGMDDLYRAGKIRAWGVSNLDVDDMTELLALAEDTGVIQTPCATDQVLYNLSRRGPEVDLLPFLADRDIPVMAYSPIEQARLLTPGVGCDALLAVGRRHGATPAQVALAWCIRSGNVLAIPKAGDPAHAQENAAALQLHLTDEDLAELDRAFPAPTHAEPLEML